MVYATRASLGLPPQPAPGRGALRTFRPIWLRTFWAWRSAIDRPDMRHIGLPLARSDATPEEVLDGFAGRTPAAAATAPSNPADRQLAGRQAGGGEDAGIRCRDLEQAQLSFSYCDIVSDIDGVVTRRNVNPGNYVDVGQSLMAVRSIREIWIDANFKEGQLADLRIGQPVRCEVDDGAVRIQGPHQRVHDGDGPNAVTASAGGMPPGIS